MSTFIAISIKVELNFVANRKKLNVAATLSLFGCLGLTFRGKIVNANRGSTYPLLSTKLFYKSGVPSCSVAIEGRFFINAYYFHYQRAYD